MEQKAIEILDQNHLMALTTTRADGWPQNTMVSYANDGLLLYFVISRQSQKFANIQKDDRVSIVIGRDFHDPATIKALSIAAHASEITDVKQRRNAIAKLLKRHPGPAQAGGIGALPFRCNAGLSGDRHDPRLFKRLRPCGRSDRFSRRCGDDPSARRRLGVWLGAQDRFLILWKR
jgi:hypothetical protein